MTRTPASVEVDAPITALLSEVEALRLMPRTAARQQTLDTLRSRVTQLRQEVYSSLPPWQRVLVSRHPQRPRTRDHLS